MTDRLHTRNVISLVVLFVFTVVVVASATTALVTGSISMLAYSSGAISAFLVLGLIGFLTMEPESG